MWLAVAEVLSGRDLLFGVADGTLARARWEGSASAALTDALVPLLSSAALAPALVWAAFAVALPLVARGRWAAVDLSMGRGLGGRSGAAHDRLGELHVDRLGPPDRPRRGGGRGARCPGGRDGHPAGPAHGPT